MESFHILLVIRVTHHHLLLKLPLKVNICIHVELDAVGSELSLLMHH
jgi:hypothetical protein